MFLRQFLFGIASLLVSWPALAAGNQQPEEAELWEAIRTGTAIAIMRHELAPGTGDPGEFRIGDCDTQRNLNDTGRKHAAATGNRFRANGIERADVVSSQWCRCLDTARLLNLGKVQELSALNSFFEDMDEETAQTARLKDWLATRSSNSPLILVTHQVNIRGLTGQSTSSGEIIVFRMTGGGVEVLGSL